MMSGKSILLIIVSKIFLMKCNSNTCFWMGSRMKMYTCK